MKNDNRSLSNMRITAARQAARNVLQRFHVEHPDAIDVETIAWHLGRLVVKEGGLDGAEGRLVATTTRGGVIRVAPTANVGRNRFTIAHEIGHWVLHQRAIIDRTDSKANFTVWNDLSEEAEANVFAAELLMPEFLLRPQFSGIHPSLKLMDSLAEEFRTSVIATVFQYWEYTNEPLAVVLSDGWEMRSFRPFKAGWPRIRFGELHENSAAGERLAEKAPDVGRMVRSPAYAWLEGFDDKREVDIKEDSRYLDYYDRTISLLWIDDPLD
jgi:Zn-dependent peptidase ImmA (M78 family)